MPRRVVLHVCESTDGGVGVVIERFSRYQLEHGWDVAVAVPSAGPVPARLEAMGARMHAWEATAQPGPQVAGELRSLAATVRAADPDIVHLHSSKAGLVGRLLVRRRRPTVMQPHAWSFFAKTGPVQRATLAWERMGARLADVIVCVSDDECRMGQEAGVHARYVVLPNGVELERFPPPAPEARAAARRQLGLGDEPIAVCVGRLHRQKNQAALIDVWPEVRARVPSARLVLVGEGPDRAMLVRGAGEGVELAGATDDARPWLAAATLVVAPSRWEAGMSLAVMEAMASGRSVVATDVAGMRAGLDGGAGAVVAHDDAAALTDAIATRLGEPELADREGLEGRRRVEERHDVAAQHRGVLDLYEGLLWERP